MPSSNRATLSSMLDAEMTILVRQEGAREPDIEPARAERIEHADLAGELERMIEYRQHGAGDHAGGPGTLRGGRQEHDRIGRIAAPVMEIVLYDPHMGVAVDVAEIDQAQGIVEILPGRLRSGDASGKNCMPNCTENLCSRVVLGGHSSAARFSCCQAAISV